MSFENKKKKWKNDLNKDLQSSKKHNEFLRAGGVLKEKWWGEKWPNSLSDDDGHFLMFTYRSSTDSKIVKVSCFECGLLEKI